MDNEWIYGTELWKINNLRILCYCEQTNRQNEHSRIILKTVPVNVQYSIKYAINSNNLKIIVQ